MNPLRTLALITLLASAIGASAIGASPLRNNGALRSNLLEEKSQNYGARRRRRYGYGRRRTLACSRGPNGEKCKNKPDAGSCTCLKKHEAEPSMQQCSCTCKPGFDGDNCEHNTPYTGANGGCADVAGGSGWLTVAKPYTPEQCDKACKAKGNYPFFTIASGDKNCKCHPSCSSANHGHTAYTSSSGGTP